LKNSTIHRTTEAAKTLEEIEHSHILSSLANNNGDITKTAKSLGISRATLYRRMKERGETR
jgi:transcriptional regulator of acetoin/glycerol metabolism